MENIVEYHSCMGCIWVKWGNDIKGMMTVDTVCVTDKLRSYVGGHIWWPQMRTQKWLIVDVNCRCYYRGNYRGLHVFSWGSLRSSL